MDGIKAFLAALGTAAAGQEAQHVRREKPARTDANRAAGKRLQWSRNKRGLTREDLAHLAGLGVATVGACEQGYVSPDAVSFRRLKEILSTR